MDVFMQNLPKDLTVSGLETQLLPLIKDLRIKDWSCQKARKKNFGSITFLHQQDGELFLRKYGQQAVPTTCPNAKPKHISRMRILSTNVYCVRSTNQPELLLLRSLVKSAEDRRQAELYPPSPEEEKVVFTTQSLSCGIYDYFDNELVYSPQVEWHSAPGTAKFAKRALIIDFNYAATQYRAEIPYRTIDAIVATTRPTALMLTLWETPRFFDTEPADLAQQMSALTLAVQNSTRTTKRRLTGVPSYPPFDQTIAGQALVYRICVSPVSFYELSEKLIRREVLTVIRHNPIVLPPYSRRDLRERFDHWKTVIRDLGRSIPFSIIFQLEALMRNGFLPPWTVLAIVSKIVQQRGASSEGPNSLFVSAEAIRKLFSQIPFPSIEVSASTFDVEEIWRYLQNNEREIRTGFHKELITERGRENLTMVHKVNITPTGISLHGPDPEAKNRILRRFPNHTEYFIRVQFCDEDGTDLRFNSRVSNEDIYNRFKHIMTNGIAICGRVYGFLGFSHSSLRSHSAWFMAPFVSDGQLHTYFTVIAHLGKFRNIYSPARCAARIGQAFSETPFAISLREHGIQWGKLPDIKSPDGKHVFSDGVGSVSQAVIDSIRDSIPRRKGAATCFQIRWGGAKGMLGLDTKLGGSTMMVRESMIKFESDNVENLEICDTANKPIPLMLNRQMIKILEDMGLPARWFLKQQGAALETLRFVTAHISNTAGYLKRQNIADRIGFPQLLRRLESIGVDYRRDQFMRSVVEAAVLRELRLMKCKARIPVEQGVTLFGIMDETAYLEEGEVFITFDDAPFVGCQAMDLGDCEMLVTRSPALHPGDIQIVTNVIPPSNHSLRALRNCIVFSQKGARDLPSCLSGGDLDGDTYGIIWDQDAVAGCQRVFRPAEYPRTEPLNIGRPVEKEDMTDFFVKFMATDQLGLIATRHMILADQREAGTDDPDCKKLAELHSTGVDYSKTGIPVDMDIFRQIRSNRYRPHFLAPSQPIRLIDRYRIEFEIPTHHRKEEEEDEDDNSGPQYLYYRSEKINGKLFDAIDERKIWYQNVKGMGNVDGRVWIELLQHLVRQCDEKIGGIYWAHMKEEAWDIRIVYEDAIYNATIDYSGHPTQGLSELEVFTGSIINASGVQTRRQRDRSLQLKDEFDRIVRSTENMIRKRTTKSADHRDGEDEVSEDPESALALSIACLEVSQSKQHRAKGSRNARSAGEYQSFKVIAACCAVRELNAAIRRSEAEEY